MKVQVTPKGYTIDGTLYPRVTKILGNLPKPALVPWAAKAVAEFAVHQKKNWMGLPDEAAIRMLKSEPISQRDDAAAAGTAVHKAIEASVKGTPQSELGSDREQRIFTGAMEFFRDYKPQIMGSEITVFSDQPEKYAGTLDLWCKIDGEPYICDFKTSKGVYADHALQLGFYERAEYRITDTDKEPWEPGQGQQLRLAIIHLQPEGYKFYDVTADYSLMDRTTMALFQINHWVSSQDVAIKARPSRNAPQPAGTGDFQWAQL